MPLDSFEKPKPTAAEQRQILVETDTVMGMYHLWEALAAGELPDTLPVEIPNPEQWQDMGSNYTTAGGLGVYESHALMGQEESSLISLMSKRNEPGQVKISASKSPVDRTEGLGRAMDLEVQAGGSASEVKCRGLLYIQTTPGDHPYDAVIVIGEDGSIANILSPGDYHSEKLYGDTIRVAQQRAEKGTLNQDGLDALRELIDSLEESGTRLAHERPDAYLNTELGKQVCEVLGIEPDNASSVKIDSVATFNAVLSEPHARRTTSEGEVVTAPVVVFDTD